MVRTFVSFHEIAVPANFGDRSVPANAQFGTLHAGNPNVAHQTGHAGFGGDGNVHVLGFPSQRGHAALREHLESIGSDRV